MAEAHIHQSLSEAAAYTAKYSYFQKTLMDNKLEGMIHSGVLRQQFLSCLGEDKNVEHVISNGKEGIIVYVEELPDSSDCFLAKAIYTVQFHAPIFGTFRLMLSNQVKQKAFVGYSYEEKIESYVYVTPNQQVYHTTRGCTHLALDITSMQSGGKGGYQPCSYCGDSKYDMGIMYVARTSNIYHLRRECGGLKRSVYRIKKSEVGGLGPCLRCGG